MPPDEIPPPGSTPTDADLAFATWYAASWDGARRLATRLLDDPADGEDLAASVLVDIWHRWRTTGRPDEPDAYLHRAIRNRSATVFRQRARARGAAPRTLAPATAEGPEDDVVVRDEVAQLLGRLPDDDRRTLELLYLDGLTGAEAARRLGIRPASVRSRVHRTRRRLAAA